MNFINTAFTQGHASFSGRAIQCFLEARFLEAKHSSANVKFYILPAPGIRDITCRLSKLPSEKRQGNNSCMVKEKET